MKFQLFFSLVLIAVECCNAFETPLVPAGGLLVLPGRQINISTSTTPSPANTTEDLETVNSRVTSRLGKELGSESGLYHILLPDGRLRRVQYTAAPVKSTISITDQNGDARSSQSQGELPSSIYYVQVPADRLPAVTSSQDSQGRSLQDSNSTTPAPSPASSDPTPSQDFLPLAVVTADQLVGGADRDARRLGNGNSYLASVQVSEVLPIVGPVYSYSPQGTVRILRAARLR